MKEIKLTRGYVARVDDDDYERLGGFNWMAAIRGRRVYAARSRPWKKGMTRGLLYMHREIMNPPQGLFVDHANGDGLDNRRSNLRVCTCQQNTRNRNGAQKNSKTGVRGVSYCKMTKRWKAQIGIPGIRTKYLGAYETIAEAAEVYWRANKQFFGEYGGK